MSAVPITSPTQAGRLEPAATGTFQRAAGIADLVAIAVGLAALLAGGGVPGLGTSPAKLAAYFAANSSAHKVDVVLSVLIAVPLTVYMIGVYRTFATAGHRHRWHLHRRHLRQRRLRGRCRPVGHGDQHRDGPDQLLASEVVSPSADAVTGHAEQQGDEAENQDHESRRPDDPDIGQDADDEQDDPGDDHDVSVLERCSAAISLRMSGGMVRQSPGPFGSPCAVPVIPISVSRLRPPSISRSRGT